MDLSQTEGDDEICPSNVHSTLSAKLSSAEEDVHSLLNLPLEDAAEAGKFKLSVLARALRASAAEGSLFDEVSHRKTIMARLSRARDAEYLQPHAPPRQI